MRPTQARPVAVTGPEHRSQQNGEGDLSLPPRNHPELKTQKRIPKLSLSLSRSCEAIECDELERVVRDGTVAVPLSESPLEEVGQVGAGGEGHRAWWGLVRSSWPRQVRPLLMMNAHDVEWRWAHLLG